MGVRATLAVLLLFIATVEAGGGVEFWKKNFTMTCPKSGVWYRKKLNITDSEKPYQELEYDGKTKGLYYCQYKEDGNGDVTVNYYFYVKGKVCTNCFELNPALFGLAIIMDVVGTAIVMMIIYKCTKKKSSAELTHTPKTPARSGGRAPPDQSSHYEPLSAVTRSQDHYAMVNRTG